MTVVESKQSQSNDERFPEVKPTEPGSDTPYIAPIIGKLGYDTRRPWLFGLGTSPNNGVDFHVFLSFDGLNFDDNDIDKIWNGGTADKVKREVDSATTEIPAAVSAANSAVQYAESAVAASKVNSDAIVAQSEAISEAKSAMDSANTEIQQLRANAASDVARIKADVASVQNEVDTAKAANSASVDQLKSDIGIAKKDLAAVSDSLTKAQAAVEQNHKALSDSVAAINSDIASTNDQLKAAQSAASDARAQLQSNVDTIKFSVDSNVASIATVSKQLDSAQASAATAQKAMESDVAGIKTDVASNADQIKAAQAANDNTAKSLATYAQQAADQGKTIKTLEDAQNGFKETIADVQGNVSQVSDNVDKLQAGLTDTNKNVATVTAKADSLSATLTGQAKSIANITATATSLQATLKDAQGRISKVETTAGEQSTLLSDLQGDLTKVSQKADSLSATLADAQKNITQIQADAKGTKEQITDLQGNVSTLQTSVSGMQATIASHDQTIHTLQVTASSLDSAIKDAKGNLSTLQQRADSLSTQLTNVAGQVNTVKATADSNTATISNLRGTTSQLKQTLDSTTSTLTNAQKDISQLQQTANGFNSKLADHDKNIATLQADSKSLTSDMSDAKGRLSKVEQTAKEHTSTISNLGDKLSNMKIGGRNLVAGTAGPYIMGFGIPNTTWKDNSAYLTLPTTLQNGGDEILPQEPDTFFYNLTKGTTYTQTVWFETDAKLVENDEVRPSFTWYTDVGHDEQPSTLVKLGENKYKVFSTYTWPGKTANRLRAFDIFHLPKAFDLTGSGTYLKFTHLKLEEGNQSTDWTPAPEDLATVTQVKQTADGIETTLKSAQGDIDQIKQTAKGTSEQLSSVQGDVTNIQKDVDGLKQTTADNAGNIHTLQSDSKTLHDSMQDAQGDISTLKKTSTDVTSELKDHAGRISKTEQTASTLVNEFADQQGHLNRVEQTAQGTQQTVANQQGQINTIKTDVSGVHQTITGQGNQIANINVTLSGLNSKYEGVSGDLGKLKSSTMQDRGTVSSPDFNSLTQAGYYTVTNTSGGKNYPVTNWGTLEVSGKDRLNQKYVGDNDSGTYTRQYNASTKSWTAWIKTANQNDVTALSDRITTNSTQITQNKQAIALKADQATVNNLSGQVSQAQAQLKVQADQISSKVSSTDFKTLNDKVDGMKIGTRNLLHGTSDQYRTLSGTGWLQKTTASDAYTSVADYHTGGWFTYAATVTNSTKHSVQLEIELRNQDKGFIQSKQSVAIPAGANDFRAFVSAQIDSNTKFVNTWLIFPNASGVAGDSIKVKDERLVEGNVAGTWEANPEDTIAAIQKNSTAIDQTNQKISLKADQTEVDQVKQTATQNSSRLDVMDGQISSKVTATDVNNIVDSKGYATTSTVQSLITQKADTISETITSLDKKVGDNADTTDKKIQEITASVNGVQSTVKNKANQSAVTQLANTYQIKLTGNLLASLGKKAQKYTVGNNTFFPFASIDVTKVTKGTVLTLSFDYSSDADCAFVPQLDGTPWIPWGDIKDNPISVKANVPGHYVKQITVGDDSWTKGTAKNIAIRIDNFGGTFTVSNLTLRSGDNVASTFDMLQYDMDLRVQKGDLLSQINLEAGRTLIQSQKIYMDADSVIMGPNTKAFIPSAAIVNLDVAKLNAGTINTDRIHIGDDSVYLSVKNNYLRLDGSNTKDKYQLRLTGNDIEFADNDSSNWEYRIQHGITKYQTDEDGLDFDVYSKRGGANHTVMAVSDAGVMISPSLFFQTDNIDSPNWMGFTRNTTDGNTAVSFHTWNDENEGFHVDCGARFLNYVYINGYARAQGWLTNSTLSKKTNIAELDTKVALDTIRQDKQYTYEYRQNVERGENDPQASLIIDDVNAVSQYTPPKEFLDRTGKYREPAVELSYLVAAVQELDSQVQQQAKLIKELKEKANE